MIYMYPCDYEELNMQQILRVLDNCNICRLGMTNGEQPYILPMEFTYETEGCHDDRRLVFMLTACKHEQKLDNARQQRKVFLEFELPTCGGLDTIFVIGKARLGDEDGCCERCCRDDDLITIMVEADAIFGRKYRNSACCN